MTALGRFGAVWGVLGVAALTGEATVRLAPIAAEAIAGGLTALQWAVLLVYCGVMAYSEGYRGFHKAFAPRVTARARRIAAEPTPYLVAFAPLVCMGLMHATKRRLTVSWLLVIGIVLLVLGVRALPQPWRGIVDAGVVVGLSIGTVSVLWFAAKAWVGRPEEVEPDFPSGPLPDRSLSPTSRAAPARAGRR